MPTIDNDSSDENTHNPEPTPPHSRKYRQVEHRETFGPQPTPTEELPPPEPWLRILVRGVLECIQGLREPQQFARWMSEDVYRSVAYRSHQQVTKLSTLGHSPQRIPFTIGPVVMSSPRTGIVEASVIVKSTPQTHAVAVRIEGLDERWRATYFGLL